MITLLPPSPIHREGYCFLSISLFLSFFVSLLARLRENRWTDLHEIFRKGVEWPWDDLIQFWINSEKRAMLRCATWGRGLLCFSTTACCKFTASAKCASERILKIQQYWTKLWNSVAYFYRLPDIKTFQTRNTWISSIPLSSRFSVASLDRQNLMSKIQVSVQCCGIDIKIRPWEFDCYLHMNIT